MERNPIGAFVGEVVSMNYDELVKELRHYSLLTIEPLHSELAKAADAIEELQEKLELANENAKAFLHTAHKLIDSQHQWVSVKERLPEKGADVLAWDEDMLVVARISIWDGKWEYRDDMSTSLPPKVTHWQPLPTPPKEE